LQILLERFHHAHVLVLGDLMLDRFVYGAIDRISPEAPIPVLTVERELDVPGGAANVARNIASLGASATLIGVVGDDAVASSLKAQLAAIPTIDARLMVDASRCTTLKTRFVAERQQVLRADREQRQALTAAVAQRLLAPFRSALETADIVVLSDYDKGVLSEEVVREAIAAARAAGKRVIVDPKSRSFSKYAGAAVLTPNRQELERATGQNCGEDAEIGSAARAALEGICDAIVVTRGALGLSVVTAQGRPTHLPASAREVFDVSGAGDTAVAALALGLAAGGDLVEAARLANVAAGLVVAKVGTAVVSAGEVIAAMHPFETRRDDDKLFSLDSVAQLARLWRAQGLKVAFANGCFDLLHTGHLRLLDQARRSADRLIVGLNTDLSVRRLKGPGRPVQGEVVRATLLSALKTVDAVVLFSEDTPLHLIETLLPDVLVKGAEYSSDQIVGADIVRNHGGRVLLAEMVPDQSTSGTLARIAGTAGT
jgi:D-beta-D-heptose 7-phosphate kinase/D-beta-D-heptose 1-phosphate adenosyltransferase